MDVTPIISRYLDALAARDLDAVADSTAPDLEFAGPTGVLDQAGYLDLLRALFAAFPDWGFEQGRLRFGWDHATVELSMHGTHTGVLALPVPGVEPVPPSGRPLLLPPEDVHFTVRNGRIARIEPDAGVRAILQQLGVEIPTAAPSADESLDFDWDE
jgi:predicted ester cyclase